MMKILTRATGLAAAMSLAVLAFTGEVAAQSLHAYAPGVGAGTVSAILSGERAPHGIAASPNGLLVLAGGGAAKVLASARTPLKELVRSSDGHGVWVDVTPLNLGDGGKTLDFNVALNTHSVDLGFDLAGMATLHDDAGNVYRATAWDGAKGGHHVTGVLRFADGERILAAKPKSLELRIDGIAGTERVFRWDLAGIR